MGKNILIDWFKEAVEQFANRKKRELPEWALNIFSGSMIAAGNVRTDEEAKAIVDPLTTRLFILIPFVITMTQPKKKTQLKHKTITVAIPQQNPTHSKL